MQEPHADNTDSELDTLIQQFDADLAVSNSLRKKSLTIEGMARKINSIERQVSKIESAQFTEVEERIAQAKELSPRITELQEKLTSHTNFSDLVDAGGLIGLRETYSAQLLSLFYRVDDICQSKTTENKKSSPLSDQKQAAAVIHGFNLFKQAYKVHKAYQGIYSGLKYKKAAFTTYVNKSTETVEKDLKKKIHDELRAIRKAKKKIKDSKLSASETIKAIKKITPNTVNPIKKLSQKNIIEIKQALAVELQSDIDTRKLPDSAKNSFGLLPDEIDLFAALLNLPYKLQHGTNHFSDIARTGRLDSLTEIHRHRPEYDSPFSTPGNLQELGNGGFIFMRCYVDGVNSEQTRYGNTRMITDLSLLREIGWVSLHDQLVPFSSHNRQQAFYAGKRLLFIATPADVNNKAQKNKSADGIQYVYRTTPVSTYQTGTKDTQKSFGTSTTTQKEVIKFTQEIFYGSDILPGIALSVIHRLRKLRSCGYRQKLLDEFKRGSAVDRVLFLGKTIKEFYRIEGKYPLGLPFEYSISTQDAFFKPVAGSDRGRRKSDRRLLIENPEGDGRQNIDLSVNTENAKYAYLNEKLRETESQIAILQKQAARTSKDEDIGKLDKYRRTKAELDNKIRALDAETEEYIIAISEVCTEQDVIWLRKRSYEFLKLVAQNFLDFVEDEIIPINDFKTISLQKLAVLSHETWIDLLNDQKDIWPSISALSLEELEGMAESNLSDALNKRGYSLITLRDLFNEDEETFSYATCDDLDALIYEHAPLIPEKLFQCIAETGADIDWDDILDNLDGTEKSTLERHLEYYLGRVPDSDGESECSALSY